METLKMKIYQNKYLLDDALALNLASTAMRAPALRREKPSVLRT